MSGAKKKNTPSTSPTPVGNVSGTLNPPTVHTAATTAGRARPKNARTTFWARCWSRLRPTRRRSGSRESRRNPRLRRIATERRADGPAEELADPVGLVGGGDADELVPPLEAVDGGLQRGRRREQQPPRHDRAEAHQRAEQEGNDHASVDSMRRNRSSSWNRNERASHRNAPAKHSPISPRTSCPTALSYGSR